MTKSQPSSIIYVDVTQLIHWSGRITGIPRVMYELAIRFAERPDARFVSWVKERRELCEVDLKQTLVNKGSGIAYVRPNEILNHTQSTDVSVIKTVQARATHLAKASARRVLRRVHRPTADRLESRLKQNTLDALVPAEIKAGDFLAIPWGEWWDSNFTAYVVAAEACDAKIVQVVHDVAPTTQPQFFEQVGVTIADYNRQILPKAALALCVSQNTKRELETWLAQENLPAPRIEVIRNGDDITITKPMQPTDEAFVKAGLKGNDYLLTVGTIEAKKNHALLYYVRKLAHARGIGLPKMVIMGRRGWLTDNVYAMMTLDPEVKDDFIFLHNTSDEELVWLYDHCMFTVQPNFHEGWGIPIAESLARGAPGVSSNTSSMVEIGDGFVQRFSPFSADECLAAIQAWLDPKALATAREHVKQYRSATWNDTFAEVIKYMGEIA